ncbi:MAG: CBS domain-containing protein [Candidatus Cloacimonetes bacterium]|nr:CBS domain-containing protein [Candidatus Cloacimonadota bacterium]MCF7813522.1 CBS domain-containing protein [Candidatus Cloacimonadota bacterium]MCF7868694.1 CBS domain-containing protein [Candidatus Cloacimonadota bacterium]MCF7884660.1 CBS domain-containing protein [Candidatus Cloacimonadota bacterium]
MLIEDILKEKGRQIISINQKDSICDVLQLFTEKKIGSVIVMDDNEKIAGIITEKDVLKCYRDAEKFDQLKIKDFMTPKENLIIASYNDDIQYAMCMMTKHRIKHLPIFKDSQLFGIISIGDLIKAQLKQSQHTAKTYLDLLEGKTPQPDNEEF